MKGLCKQPSSPAAVIINSGNEKSKGEHWEAIYISPTDLKNKSRVEFFDSYGLPPIQDGTSKLLDLLSQKDWVCNHQPVQDIMDMTSRACGHSHPASCILTSSFIIHHHITLKQLNLSLTYLSLTYLSLTYLSLTYLLTVSG